MANLLGRLVVPGWEPAPWNAGWREAGRQRTGFCRRAGWPLVWVAVPWADLPGSGVFGMGRDRLVALGVVAHAGHRQEEMLLIRNDWHGWPDPPEYGLISRTVGGDWTWWGHFAVLPEAWTVPVEALA